MKHESQNDHLIDQFIKDPLYKINKDGTVYTKLTLNGQGITDDWREIGYKKKDGYVRFRYKDDFLFAHRVIYRKFKGELKSDMTVNHKNLDNSDNHPDNLELISQGDNNKKKHKKYKKSFDRNVIIAKVMKKLASSWQDFIRGEYWITDDGSEYADSNVSDKSHEYIAVEQMVNGDDLLEALQEYNAKQDPDDRFDLKEYEDWGEEYSLGASLYFGLNIPNGVGEKVVGKDKWKDLKKDPRLAYAKYYGAVHAIDNNFSAYKLTDKIIRNIQSHIEDQLVDDKNIKGDVVLEEYSTGKDATIPVNDFLNIKHVSELWRLA